jgi:hypothetical protein
MLTLAVALGLVLGQAGEQAPKERPTRPEFYLPPTHRPTLSEISMTVHVSAAGQSRPGVVTLPVPSDYSGQAVISFKVDSDPPSALRSWALQKRPDGLNWVVKATLEPRTEAITVGYVARMLVPGEGVVRTQHKNFNAWLAPSARVQSNDPAIVSLAKKLQAGTSSPTQLVGQVVRWVAANKLRQNTMPGQSDAKSALIAGGDSLGRANLCAAILRADHIATRTVAAIPSWAEKMDAETWVVEYWTEDGNWQLADPTVGIQFPARNSTIVLAISSVADENESTVRPSALRPDASVLSTPEISPHLSWAPAKPGELATTIHVIRAFPPQSGARLMTAAHRRSLKVSESALLGKPEWFDDNDLNRVIAKGPINLALYLDGKPTFP